MHPPLAVVKVSFGEERWDEKGNDGWDGGSKLKGVKKRKRNEQ